MMAHMKRTTSLILIFSATIGYGLMPIFTRISYDGGMLPLELVLLRFGGAALILISFQLLTGRARELVTPTRTALRIVVNVGLPFTLVIVAKFFAFQTMPMGVVQAIFYGYPAWVMIIAAIKGRERLRLTNVIGYVVIFIGIVMTLDMSDMRISTLGVLLSVASMLLYGWYVTSIKHPEVLPVSSAVITTYTMTTGAVITALLLLFTGPHDFSFHPSAWYGVAGLVFISSIGAFYAFNLGAKYVESSIAAIICCFETIVTVIFELVFLSGQYSIRQYAGIVLIPMGITFSLLFTIRAARGSRLQNIQE